MNLGIKVKELRMENNLTQEDLAEQLGVSFQAVSRWETGVTYPDITLLPVLANMFDVTVDYLLDVDILKKEEEINQILKKDDELSHVGKVKEREHLLEQALKKYPNNWDFKSRLLSVYHVQTANATEDDEIYQKKVIELGNHILEKCTIDSKRYLAIGSLIFVYDWIGETKKAEEIASSLPENFYDTKEYALMTISHGKENNKAVKDVIYSVLEMFDSALWYYRGINEEKLKVYLKYKELIDVIFEDGNYLFFNERLASIYEQCAIISARLKNKEECLKYLSLALDYAKKFDETIKEAPTTYTSLLMSGFEENPRKWKKTNEISSLERVKSNFEETKLTEFIVNDEDYKKIMEKYYNKPF